MPTSSEAVNGSYQPVIVPNQIYNRSEYEDPEPTSINPTVDTLPQISSTIKTTSSTSSIKAFIIIAGISLVITAAGVLPAVIVSKTVTTTNSTINSSISLNNTATVSSTTSGLTTTICPTNPCSYSTSYSLTSSEYYGVEHVNINCTQTLSNLTAFINVQRTVNAMFASQYNTFYSGTVNQVEFNTSSPIIYLWSSISNQTISSNGFPYYVEAQFQ